MAHSGKRIVKARETIERIKLYKLDEAVKVGIPELEKELDTKAGEDAEEVDIEDYLGFGGDTGKAKPKARVALIYGTGLISSRSNGPADVSGEKDCWIVGRKG